MDYKKLGLRVGLEIHQQLAGNRLFCCKCPCELNEDEPEERVKRRLYAVAGELGKVDPAAMQAQMRGLEYIYEFHSNVNCLVSLDEEPPYYSNMDAIDTIIGISLMLDANVIDELHLMRKTVIDGSNPSGFQRTMLVATGGKLKHGGIEIGIPTICLEEDAARKIGTEGRTKVYNLDRLGIPLIELATEPTIKSPEEAKLVASYIGDVLRATGKVKRGIGTIRQDLNVSIEQGARVEIKGVQELNILPRFVENEVSRQVALLDLKEDLKKGAKKVKAAQKDISGLLKNTKSKILNKSLENRDRICAIRLEGLSGVLKRELIPGRRFGTELAEYAKAYGANGLMHSDELPNYGVTQEEVDAISKELGVKEKDAFILITHSMEDCSQIIEKIVERVNYAFEGIPEETRRALQDGTSAYMRPLPGGFRMYPETDMVPLAVTGEMLDMLKKNLPKMPWEQIKEICTKYGLSEQLARELYRSDYYAEFGKLAKETRVEPRLIASTLIDTLRSIDTDGVELGYSHFRDLFTGISGGRYSKEALPSILEKWAVDPGKKLDEIIKELNLGSVSDKGIEDVVLDIVKKNKKLIEERGERAIQPLMGMVMKELRGRADGKTIMDILRKKVNEK